MKNILIRGVVSGLLAATASIIYLKIYENLFFVDFNSVINETAIVVSSLIGCMLMAIGYILLYKVKKPNLIGAMNILIMVLSYLSILPALAMTLPLDVEFPELFPGMVVPMHFFPVITFFGFEPFFKSKK